MRKAAKNRGGVEYIGFVGRKKLNELYGSAVGGLVVLLPMKNYIESKPIKMYEYMAAGLPFIASDFPLWKDVVQKYACGICVPANDPQATHEAIQQILTNREYAQQMGRRGRDAVEQEFNWEKEADKLLAIYGKCECQ